jgi:purine nucleosidase
MAFPKLTEAARVARLALPEAPVRMVLDTDTYNEIDDQFALTYALLSPERLVLEAVYAAPFHNERSSGPEDGMERSYAEILRLLERFGRPHDGFAFRGSTGWMSGPDKPVASAAATDLIARAAADDQSPLYVVAIGAPTNVASALLMAPEIAERVVVVWLGGHAGYWHQALEFNLMQDPHASRVLLDSGVPLVRVPCFPVTSQLCTTEAEVDRFVKGRGPIGDYLSETYSACYDDHTGRSRAIWDMGPIAWLVDPAWANSALVHSPILTSEMTWSHDQARHLGREVRSVERDPIFRDFFAKLEVAALPSRP